MVIAAGLETDLYSVDPRSSVASVEVSGEVRTRRRPLSVSERLGGSKDSSDDVKRSFRCAAHETERSVNAVLSTVLLVIDFELSVSLPSSST